MAEFITEIHSISSAAGWKFLHDDEPVACFALVSVVDAAYPSLGSKKIIVGLSKDLIADEIVGLEASSEMRNIERVSGD